MPHALKPVRTAAPAAQPVSVEEVWAQPSVGSAADSDLVEALIEAATAELDGWSGQLGRCLVTQSWRFDFAGFPCDSRLRLPLGDLQSLAVTYVDTAGATQTLSSALYRTVTDALGPCVELLSGESWPATATRSDAVRVAAVLGYGDAEDVPAPIRRAILLRVGQLYNLVSRDVALKKRVVEGVGSREWDVAGASAFVMDRAITSLLSGYRRISFLWTCRRLKPLRTWTSTSPPTVRKSRSSG